MRIVACLCLALAAAVLPAGHIRGADRAVQFSVAGADPGLSGEIAVGGTLYIKIAYTSDHPVRFRAEGFALGRNVRAGAMYNPAPPYPAGSGEALAWIAYRGETSLDEIRITASDGAWKPLAAISEAAMLSWSKAARPVRAASWATQLSDAQQAAASEQMRAATEEDEGEWLVFALLVGSVLAYFVLQPLTLYCYEGGWRIASLLPLAATVPLVVHAALALAAGSNLWPILLILFLPFASLYLLGLIAARKMSRLLPGSAT